MATEVSPQELRVTLSADRFAYFVHLEVPHAWTHFSDNYFDLEPGETRTITLTNPNAVLRPAVVRRGWR